MMGNTFHLGIDFYGTALLCLVNSVVSRPKATRDSKGAAQGSRAWGLLSEQCSEHMGKPQSTLYSPLPGPAPPLSLGLST